jgi:hypothetical protein
MLRLSLLVAFILIGCSTPKITHVDLARKSLPYEVQEAIAPCLTRQSVKIFPPSLSQHGLWNLMDLDDGKSSIFFPESLSLDVDLVQDPCHAKSTPSGLKISLRDSGRVLNHLILPLDPPTPVMHMDGHDRMSELRAEIKVISICDEPVELWGQRIKGIMDAQKSPGPESEPRNSWSEIREDRRKLVREKLCRSEARRILLLRCIPRWGNDTLPEFFLNFDSRRLGKVKR